MLYINDRRGNWPFTAQRAVRPDAVVVLAPFFEQYGGPLASPHSYVRGMLHLDFKRDEFFRGKIALIFIAEMRQTNALTGVE